MESILVTIKKMIGPSALYDVFDTDIITHINTIFFRLYQLGIGPDTPFKIEDDSAEWTDFVDDGSIEAVKTYIYIKTKLYFDPPTNSALLSAMQEQCKELEWTMNVEVDPRPKDV